MSQNRPPVFAVPIPASADETDLDGARPRASRDWSRLDLAETDPLAAAFAAAAMLGRLNTRVREEPDFSGAFRQRLALQVAAATGIKRIIDAGSLRDLLYLTGEGDDPGPQGRALQAWRLLNRPDAASVGVIAKAAALFGLPTNPRLSKAMEQAAAMLDAPSDAIPPIHAARVAALVYRGAPEAEWLAYWCADVALAAAMGWPRAIPLLGAGLSTRGASFLQGDTSPVREGKFCAAYARAARKAADLHAELERAAARLHAAAPKLRSKQARLILDRLLADDAVPGSVRVSGMTARSVRRLFDRLVALGAVRELTGRATFRLYGL